MFWHSMIDASFSVITCSFITIPRLFRDIKKNVASMSIDAKRLKTTPHEHSLATLDSRGCDVESQNTIRTNTTCQSHFPWNSSNCVVKDQDSFSTDIPGKSQFLWNALGCDAWSQNTISTNFTGKSQLSWDLILVKAGNPVADYEICLDC
jgi:hypothetical protein